MNNFEIHPANSRGYANHGWLEARHSFSFASYHNPKKIHFGVLRVLNDDIIAGGKGFGAHPHDNMEIITIPLRGGLIHKDNMGNSSVINAGDIQVMSAGSGIEHSEHNNDPLVPLSLFQIWLFPKLKNVTPRYQQITLNKEDRKNKIQQILSPHENDEGVWIHQDAWFYLLDMDTQTKIDYQIKRKENGIFLMVIEGSISIQGNRLNKRDAITFINTHSISIEANENSELLILDIPITL